MTDAVPGPADDPTDAELAAIRPDGGVAGSDGGQAGADPLAPIVTEGEQVPAPAEAPGEVPSSVGGVAPEAPVGLAGPASDVADDGPTATDGQDAGGYEAAAATTHDAPIDPTPPDVAAGVGAAEPAEDAAQPAADAVPAVADGPAAEPTADVSAGGLSVAEPAADVSAGEPSIEPTAPQASSGDEPAGGREPVAGSVGSVDADGESAVAAAAGVQAPSAAAGATPVLPPPPPELAELPADAGRIVTGRVKEVRSDDLLVDLDDGRVGVINSRNLGAAGDIAAQFPVGAEIEGAVLARSDPQHRVVLSRTWALKKRAWEDIVSAAAENRPLTGKVVSIGGKGLVVDVGVRGFVPASHLELGPVSDLAPYAGTELTLRVLDVDADRERLVLSRRSLLLKEQRRSVHDVLAGITAGEVRRGRVTSLSDYGAFVDLGGVNGLVHLSELTWHRVRHPSEVLNVGDEVDVKVLDVKVKKRRVSLSIRQLAADPLTTLVPGEIRSGPVTRLVDFGAFVDLSGVEGLVHLSELAEHRVSTPEEVVAPGEEVRVKVLSVDRKRRRVELSIRRAAEYGG